MYIQNWWTKWFWLDNDNWGLLSIPQLERMPFVTPQSWFAQHWHWVYMALPHHTGNQTWLCFENPPATDDKNPASEGLPAGDLHWWSLIPLEQKIQNNRVPLMLHVWDCCIPIATPKRRSKKKQKKHWNNSGTRNWICILYMFFYIMFVYMMVNAEAWSMASSQWSAPYLSGHESSWQVCSLALNHESLGSWVQTFLWFAIVWTKQKSSYSNFI